MTQSVQSGNLEATTWTQAFTEQLCSTTVLQSGFIPLYTPGGAAVRALHAGECCWFTSLVPTHVGQWALFWAKNLLALHKATTRIVQSWEIQI